VFGECKQTAKPKKDGRLHFLGEIQIENGLEFIFFLVEQ